jgi:hypothetical protein
MSGRSGAPAGNAATAALPIASSGSRIGPDRPLREVQVSLRQVRHGEHLAAADRAPGDHRVGENLHADRHVHRPRVRPHTAHEDTGVAPHTLSPRDHGLQALAAGQPRARVEGQGFDLRPSGQRLHVGAREGLGRALQLLQVLPLRLRQAIERPAQCYPGRDGGAGQV